MEKLKVLVVDDEFILRKGISNLVDWEKYGYQLIGAASNAREALSIIDDNKPHIVLTDIVMPNISGVELTKLIYDKYPDIKVIVISSYDDFHYVKSAFQYGVSDYILKPTLNEQKILSTLTTVSQSIRPDFEDNDPSINLSIFQNEMSNFFNNNNYTMTNISSLIENKRIFFLRTTPINKSTYKLIRKNIEYNFDKSNTYVHYDKYIVACILEDITCLESKINYILDYIKSIDVDSFVSYTSQTCTDFDINKGIDYLSYLSGYSFFHSDTRKKHMYIPFDSTVEIDRTLKFKDKVFFDMIEKKGYIQALEYLENTFNDITFDDKITEQYLKMSIEHAFYNYIHLVDFGDSNTYELQKMKFTLSDTFNNCTNVGQLHINITTICETLKDKLIKLDAEDLTNRIFTYIDTHYAQNITLKSLAEKFHFSYSYLSSYLNENSNDGFSDYLIKVRIDKSKQLLKSTNYSISKIALEVGFNDSGYFSKVFKKQEGITPSKYRRKS